MRRRCSAASWSPSIRWRVRGLPTGTTPCSILCARTRVKALALRVRKGHHAVLPLVHNSSNAHGWLPFDSSSAAAMLAIRPRLTAATSPASPTKSAGVRPPGHAGFPPANGRRPPHSLLSPPHPLPPRSLSPSLTQTSRPPSIDRSRIKLPLCPHAPRARHGRSSSSRSNGRPHRLHRHLHGLRRQAAPVPLASTPHRLLLRLLQRQHPLHLHQDLLRSPRPLLRPPLLRRHLPTSRRRRHRRPDPLQGVQGLREAREAVGQEAHLLAQEVRARLGPRARHPGHHRQDQAPLRQLRQVRPALRLRRPAPPHRQRRPAALGRVHHPRRALPLHRGMDRVGRQELPHRHQRREEACHEGDHHRRRARDQDHPQGIHLAGCCLPRVDQRRPRRRRRRHRLLSMLAWLVGPQSDGQRRTMRACRVSLCGLGVGADRIMEK